MDRLFKKVNLDEILDKLCGYAFDRNIFYHNSIDSYYSGKETSFWRKIKFYFRFLVLTLWTVKSGMSTLFPNKVLFTPLIDLTVMFGKQAILINAHIFSICIVGQIGICILRETKEFQGF